MGELVVLPTMVRFLVNGVGIGSIAAYYIGTALILQKAGVGRIRSLIPLYQQYLFVKVTSGEGMLILGMFVPMINLVTLIKVHMNLVEAFNKDWKWKVGAVIVPPFIVPLIGFDDSQYGGPVGFFTHSD